jgi:hypothetical protein
MEHEGFEAEEVAVSEAGRTSLCWALWGVRGQLFKQQQQKKENATVK